MRKAGAAVVIEDGDLTPALLAETVAGIIDDPERLERMRSASSSLALPDAAASVASEILAVGGVGSRG